ncbi:MAG: hypothetical protein SPG34_06870 [Trueperella sp.]|uniref:hypothetical protein n=1 Tax=Trueperella sp. TaxID=2699835 RepID=UPI002A920046|nr:hypothetical protein [Trueperella sp.]MDY5404038.1 hypothetical protein [Trueperella sp.]
MSAIFLIGASGTGKSAIVRELAKAGFTAADVDAAVAESQGYTLEDFYVLLEPERRKALVARALDDFLDDVEADPAGRWALAIPSDALGESLEEPTKAALVRARLRDAGTVVKLTADLSTLVTRNGLIGQRSATMVMPRKEFRLMLAARDEVYDAVAHYTFDTTKREAADVARELVALV